MSILYGVMTLTSRLLALSTLPQADSPRTATSAPNQTQRAGESNMEQAEDRAADCIMASTTQAHETEDFALAQG